MSDNVIYKLVLYPTNTEYVPDDWGCIKLGLEKLGFIGGAIPLGDENYYVGDRFLQLITFLGCSPQIQIEPTSQKEPDDDKFCRVVLSKASDNIQFKYFSRDVAARCPKCRKNLSCWSGWVEQWRESPNATSVKCEHCACDLSLFDLNWRHNAAFSRCFIDVWHIYPQEAIPTEELLRVLSEVTNQEWDYFFSDQ